jgi:hypothetical protein
MCTFNKVQRGRKTKTCKFSKSESSPPPSPSAPPRQAPIRPSLAKSTWPCRHDAIVCFCSLLSYVSARAFFLCDTVRHGTTRYGKNRHTNKLEGLFPYVRLRYNAVRYDTARFFLSQGCAIFGEIYRAAKGRDVTFSLMTTLFCERKQKKSLSKNKWPDLKHWST